MSYPSILLIEDDDNDEELVRLALAENNIKIDLIVFKNGAEALDYLLSQGEYDKQEGQKPSLIILDLKLPKLSGLEVLQKIRANELIRYLPIVVFTSSKEEQDIMESYRLGANAFVRKPIDFKEFSHAVRDLGTFWTTWNQANLT
jgi:two-component system response regulator